jgi:hypothetical protein
LAWVGQSKRECQKEPNLHMNELNSYNIFKSLKIFKISLTFRFDTLWHLSKSIHTGENFQILTVSNKKISWKMLKKYRKRNKNSKNEQNGRYNTDWKRNKRGKKIPIYLKKWQSRFKSASRTKKEYLNKTWQN